jgi:hypothetical protein
LKQQIKCGKWKWIGHTLRKGSTDIENQALKFESSRTTEERKAKDDMERKVAEEAGKSGKTWKEVRALA